MGQIYFTSDLHLGHNKPFIYEDRGFSSIEEHDQAVIQNINDTALPDDTLYILGDVYMNRFGTTSDPNYPQGVTEIPLNEANTKYGTDLLSQISCRDVRVILGNHDTKVKAEYIGNLPNFSVIGYADQIREKKQNFFLSHYPTITQSGEYKGSLQFETINLFGHTHQKEPFMEQDGKKNLLGYNVGLDANGLKPVSIDHVLEQVKEEYSKVASTYYGVIQRSRDTDHVYLYTRPQLLVRMGDLKIDTSILPTSKYENISADICFPLDRPGHPSEIFLLNGRDAAKQFAERSAYGPMKNYPTLVDYLNYGWMLEESEGCMAEILQEIKNETSASKEDIEQAALKPEKYWVRAACEVFEVDEQDLRKEPYTSLTVPDVARMQGFDLLCEYAENGITDFRIPFGSKMYGYLQNNLFTTKGSSFLEGHAIYMSIKRDSDGRVSYQFKDSDGQPLHFSAETPNGQVIQGLMQKILEKHCPKQSAPIPEEEEEGRDDR